MLQNVFVKTSFVMAQNIHMEILDYAKPTAVEKEQLQ